MKLLNHPITLAFGISTVSLFFLIEPLASPDHQIIYHLKGSATALFLSALVYFFYFWLITLGVLLLAKSYRRLWLPIWLGITFFLPAVVAKNAIMIQMWPVPRQVSVTAFLLLLGIFAALLFIRRTEVEKVFLPVQRVVSVLLGLSAIAGVAMLTEFLWFGWEARDLNPPFVQNPGRNASPATAAHRRIIWILLDELSNQQVYGARYPGLSLPAFDRLAEQSVVFSHVVPAGIFTQSVVPSLFSGLSDDLIRVSADGQLKSLRNPATGAWQPFDQNDTIFADAHAANYATGIAGWFNPYCRLLPKVLDRCFWVNRTYAKNNSQSDSTWQAKLSRPFRFFVSYIQSFFGTRGPEIDVVGAELHIHDFEDIRDETDALLENPSMDFVFLHIPAPHPPGIFDRKRMTFTTTGSSYLDNLVLADQYLAHVRLLLTAQHQWDSSMVIVMGDHSWRAQLLWRGNPGWTQEDEQASHGGQFDDRPGYIVKMPLQQNALRVDSPFPAVKTRALLDAVMSRQLQTGEDLKLWAEQQR